MKLTLLGTGSPKPTVERCSSGYLLETGEDAIMLEVGPGTVYRLLQAGRSVTDVSHVIISHLHFDHWLDLIRLIMCRWDIGHPDLPPLKIWAPAGMNHILERTIGADGALKFDLTARTTHPQSLAIYHGRGGKGERPWPSVELAELNENTVVEGATWRATFTEVPHHQPYLISYGMRMEADGGLLAYSSDITRDPKDGAPPGLYEVAKDADLLIQYVNVFGAHLSDTAREVEGPTFHGMIAEMARESNVKAMVTTHQSPHLNVNGVRERIISDICRIYPGRLIWGQDLMSLEVGGQ